VDVTVEAAEIEPGRPGSRQGCSRIGFVSGFVVSEPYLTA
jgi:hypothetical protein